MEAKQEYLCDSCEFYKQEILGNDEGGYPHSYCAKGHWEGRNYNETMPKIDPWKDCHDFLYNI